MINIWKAYVCYSTTRRIALPTCKILQAKKERRRNKKKPFDVHLTSHNGVDLLKTVATLCKYSLLGNVVTGIDTVTNFVSVNIQKISIRSNTLKSRTVRT